MPRAILVVDDDPMMRRTLVRVLREHGPIVDVDSAEKALALVVSGKRFAAILCDLRMRGLSGVDLFMLLRTLAPDQAERFVALTGGSIDDLEPDFRTAIGGRLLLKPFNTEQLVSILLGAANSRGRTAHISSSPPI